MKNDSDSIKPGDLVEIVSGSGKDEYTIFYLVNYKPELPLQILWMLNSNDVGFPLQIGVFVRAEDRYMVLLHPEHGFVIGFGPPQDQKVRKFTEGMSL